MTERPQLAGRPSPQPGPAPEPEEVIAPDEAPTPVWLPLVGLALGIVGLGVFAATRPSGDATPAQAGAADGATSAEPAAPTPSLVPPAGRRRPDGGPSGLVRPSPQPGRTPRPVGPTGVASP